MGHALSTKTKKSQSDSMHISKLNKLYHSKMYAQNRKSFEKFMKQIEAVCKKTSYLDYKWAKDVHNKLQSTKIDELYSQYQTVFQQNCRRDGRHELVFYAMHIQKIFLECVTAKYNFKQQVLDASQLKQLIFQCKCYLMVMNWLHKISSLNQAKSKDLDESQKQIFVRFMQEDIVYSQLVEIASKAYAKYLRKEQVSRIMSGQFEYDQKEADNQIMAELRKLKKCKNYHQKQLIIHKIERILLSNEQKFNQRMDLIEKMFGKSKIFATLLIIKELGSIDISKLWIKIFGTIHNQLFA